MTKSKEITRTIIAVMIALVIAVSSAAIMGAVKADAATVRTSSQKAAMNKLPASTSKLNQFADSYTFKATGKTTKGYDWTYKADTNNLKVSCKYNFSAHRYSFKITGKSYGLSHITLKYKVSDKKWASEKMTVFVDSKNYIMRTA